MSRPATSWRRARSRPARRSRYRALNSASCSTSGSTCRRSSARALSQIAGVGVRSRRPRKPSGKSPRSSISSASLWRRSRVRICASSSLLLGAVARVEKRRPLPERRIRRQFGEIGIVFFQRLGDAVVGVLAHLAPAARWQGTAAAPRPRQHPPARRGRMTARSDGNSAHMLNAKISGGTERRNDERPQKGRQARPGEQFQDLEGHDGRGRDQNGRRQRRRPGHGAFDAGDQGDHRQQAPENDDFDRGIGLRVAVAGRVAAGEVGERRQRQGPEQQGQNAEADADADSGGSSFHRFRHPSDSSWPGKRALRWVEVEPPQVQSRPYHSQRSKGPRAA